MRPQLSAKFTNVHESEADLRHGIIRYYMCAKVLFRNENSEEIKNALRNIINKQDNKGRTPLYLAAKDWPKAIIQSLLKFGADMSIPSNEGKYPIKRLKEEDILEVFNTHCMKSKALYKLSKSKSSLLNNRQLSDNQENYLEKEEQDAYTELMENYEPRFMTYIGHAPVKFDYEILAPTRYKPDESTHRIKQPEMEVLSQLCESKAHKKIIKHPVVKSWVWLKWNRVRRYYHKELRLDLLLMWFMTWYVIQTFGGFEWNNKCEKMKARSDANPDWDWTNYTDADFCKYYEDAFKKEKEIDAVKPFGHLESKNITSRIKYHFDVIFGNSLGNHSCMYSKPAYVVFLVMACGLLYWMAVDAVEMCNPPNEIFQRHSARNTFFSKVVPMFGFLRDFTIIMAVIIFSDAMLWIAITVLFLSMLLGEINQFIVQPKNYVLSPKNWSDILQLILIAVILYVPNEYIVDPFSFALSCHIDQLCPEGKDPKKIFIEQDVSVKRGLAAFLIVLSWSRLLIQIANHPSKRTEQLNKYAMMYKTVAKSFMKLFFVYGLVLISFSIGFYVVFHEDIGVENLLYEENGLSPYQFFNTPYEAFAKTIAMFMGEVDFNNMPIGISYRRRDGNVSVTLAYLFFLTFIFMVVMVLMNLLNGLAVSDIAEIVAEAEVKHQASMINILKEFEDRAMNNKTALDYFSKYLPCLGPFLQVFDFEQELKMFPEKKDEGGLVSRKMKPIKLPYEIKGEKDKNGKRMNRLNWLYMTRQDKKMKVGYEHILSEARKILYESNKTEMDKNIS